MKKLSPLIFLAFLMSACTTPVNPDFLTMSEKYSQILVQYQIDTLAANIIRTSRDEPLSFLDMPNISGSGNVSQSLSNSLSFQGVSIGAPTLYGGSLSSLSNSYSLSWGNSFSFSQSSLDNSAFWKAFLQPVKPDALYFFIHNHIPNELLFHLTVGEIVISYPDGSKKAFYNNPLSSEYAQFQNEAQKLLALGITVEEYEPGPSVGSAKPKAIAKESTPSKVTPTESYTLPPQGVDGIVKPPPGFKASAPSSDPQMSATSNVGGSNAKYRICLGDLKKAEQITKEYGSDVLCHSPYLSKKIKTPQEKAKEPTFSIYIRSARTMFDYLGQVAYAQQRDKDPFLVTIPPSSGTINKKAGQDNAYALLIFNKNKPAFDDFSSVSISNGNQYTIPRENSGYSTLTINLLAQFMGLVKSPASIPASNIGILIR
jgi:hypothetical protein